MSNKQTDDNKNTGLRGRIVTKALNYAVKKDSNKIMKMGDQGKELLSAVEKGNVYGVVSGIAGKEVANVVKKGSISNASDKRINSRQSSPKNMKFSNTVRNFGDTIGNKMKTLTSSNQETINTVDLSNIDNTEPILFSIKVMKTQTESKNNIPASILSIIDYFLTYKIKDKNYKGIKFKKVKDLDGMTDSIMSFFSLKDNISMLDILQKCSEDFGEIDTVTGIKSLCVGNNIITFKNKDETKQFMNEWDVIKIIYNQLIQLKEKSFFTITDYLTTIKKVCGNIQALDLTKINKSFITDLKGLIEEHCKDINAVKTEKIQEFDKMKTMFLEKVCNNPDELTELSTFLVTYFNFFLDAVNDKKFPRPAIVPLLISHVHTDMNYVGTKIKNEKNINLFVEPNTMTEFLDNFSKDNIVINISS